MDSPAEVWHSLLRHDVELAPDFASQLTARMREARLTFGDRVHCPFLRPFFLTADDEARVRRVAELIAALGERVVERALESPDLLADVALRPDEERLVRIDPGYRTASTASRLDAFLLPNSLQFAEYNGESPAGAGYSETLGDIFDTLPIMERFKERFEVQSRALSGRLLEALLASYREWGGTEATPVIGIVDWREVPTWTEFEILKSRFEALGVPTLLADPRELEFTGTALMAGGRRIDLLYRRVLLNDIVARPAECKALVDACLAGALCMANTFQCKIPHKKAFFAVLTDDRHERLFSAEERSVIREHVPWTRLVRNGRTGAPDGETIDLIPFIRGMRQDLVLKPNDEYGGAGVTLGWEASESEWDRVLDRALGPDESAWVVQKRISIRREIFPRFDSAGVSMSDMLVDFAPYLYRGRMAGFLTRLSSTGLANVTSGGGQVPAFVVTPR